MPEQPIQFQQLQQGLRFFLEEELKHYPAALQPSAEEKKQMVAQLASALLKKENRPNPSLHKDTLKEILQAVVFTQVLFNKNKAINHELWTPEFNLLLQQRLDSLSPSDRKELTLKLTQSLDNFKKTHPLLSPFIDNLKHNFEEMMQNPNMNKNGDEIFSDALSITLQMMPKPSKTKESDEELEDEATAYRRLFFRVDPEKTGEIPVPLVNALCNFLGLVDYNPNQSQDSMTISEDAYNEPKKDPIDTISEVLQYYAHQKNLTPHSQ